MAVLVDTETRVLVQGITGAQGSFHTQLMQEYGTRIMAGTSPGKSGVTVHGVPVYNTVADVVRSHVVDASVVFVPAPFAAEAALEAIEAGVATIVVITEHVPVKDAVALMSYACDQGARVVGPNTPGVISPGKTKVGILPPQVFSAGYVGVVSRSGTLTYEVASELSAAGLGQSTCIGVGGDAVVGINFLDVLELFRKDQKTKAVAIIGEIGGNMEEATAEYITETRYPKPVVAYIAGRTAPIGKRMGHAGAIVLAGAGSAASKVVAFEAAGVAVADKPRDIARLVHSALRRL